MKPIAGTELCPHLHVVYQVSGRQRIRLADGTELDVDAQVIPPGHDGWVLGDEPVVAITIE